MNKVGILGGTFDPPHIGHLIMAETMINSARVDRVIFVPVGQPTHKTTMTPAKHRVEMTRLAVLGDERFSVDEIDVNRPGPHYTVDLVPLLREKWPDGELFLILGGDSVADLPDWHRPQRLLADISILGLARPGYPIPWETLKALHPNIQQRIKMIDGPSVFISSTSLRSDLNRGICSRYSIPAGVRAYLIAENLYANGREAD